MEIKLIAIDLDGTLLTWNKKISIRNSQAIIETQKRGHKVVFASGRDMSNIVNHAMKAKLDEFNGYMAAFNGSHIFSFKDDAMINENKFSQDLLVELREFLEAEKMDFTFLRPDEQYISKDRVFLSNLYRRYNGKKSFDIDLVFENNLSINKILVNDKKSKLIPIFKKLEEKFGDRLSLSMSSIVSIEITPLNSDKGFALEYIAKRENISMENTIAIGNQGNDIPMLQKASHAIAVSNAIERIKKQADYITDTNNKDGVAKYLEKFIL